jgi:futalosine hydrolase
LENAPRAGPDTVPTVRDVLVVAATARELELGGDARTLRCGIGPVEAAAATARELAARPPDAVLHFGVAGGRGVPVGAVVLGSAAVYCDVLAAVPVPDRVLPDAALLAVARRALPDALVAPIGTSARVGGTTGCGVEAMEGFAVLRAAELAGVPALEVRAVSNDVDEADRSLWRLDEALAALAAALPPLLGALRQ